MSAKTTASVFQDTIDGYFPLQESLQQLMLRNELESALIRMIHAPSMHVPNIGLNEPVPLHVVDKYSCMIHHMTLLIEASATSIEISGVAQWHWQDRDCMKDTGYSLFHRLAEPALVKGIGMSKCTEGESHGQEVETVHKISVKWPLVKNLITWGHCCVDENTIVAVPARKTEEYFNPSNVKSIYIPQRQIGECIEIFNEYL